MRNRRHLALTWALALFSVVAGTARLATETHARTVADPPPGYCAVVDPAPNTWGGAVVCTP